MGLVISNSTIELYSNFLTKLDTDSKKKLILKLTESLESSSEFKDDMDNIFGAWEDNRSSDEIIKFIRESMVNKSDVEPME